MTLRDVLLRFLEFFQLRFVISIYFWPDTEVWLDSNLVLVLTQLML